MQEVRSKRKNARIFSWAVRSPLHSFGKVSPAVFPRETWKSLKRTRPHWFAGAELNGVLKV
jgi:hypothetical protein